MKNASVVLVLLAILGGSVWAQAEFSAVNGKVEIRPSAGGEWTAADVGMEIDNDTMISTGFNASATIQMGDSSVSVDQLTRMVFEQIVERSDSVETRLNLNVGRMSAQVRSSDGRSQDFQVRSPVSTAAVRGTGFTFDGERLSVQEGRVAFLNKYGQQRSVGRGQTSTNTGAPGGPSDPADEAQDNNTTSTDPIGAGSSDDNEGTKVPVETVPPGPRRTRGSVNVEISE